MQAVNTIKRLVAVAVPLFGNTKFLRANTMFGWLQDYFRAATSFKSETNSASFFSEIAAKINATTKIRNNTAHFFIIRLIQIVL